MFVFGGSGERGTFSFSGEKETKRLLVKQLELY
jgi:hypothetical protein